jgi:hypothetical protein
MLVWPDAPVPGLLPNGQRIADLARNPDNETQET